RRRDPQDLPHGMTLLPKPHRQHWSSGARLITGPRSAHHRRQHPGKQEDQFVISLDIRHVQPDDKDRPTRVGGIDQEADSFARPNGTKSLSDDIGVIEGVSLTALIVPDKVSSEITSRTAAGRLPASHPPEPLPTWPRFLNRHYLRI